MTCRIICTKHLHRQMQSITTLYLRSHGAACFNPPPPPPKKKKKLPGCLHLSSLLSRRPSPPLCLVALSCGCVALFTHPQRLHAPDRTVDGARSTTINATPTQPSASFTAYGTRVSVCKKKSWLRRVGAEQFMLHCASGVVLAPAAPPLVFVLDSSPAPKLLPPPPFPMQNHKLQPYFGDQHTELLNAMWVHRTRSALLVSSAPLRA